MDSRSPAMDALRLREVEHPDLSSRLVHFVDRGRMPGRDVPPEIVAMSAEERLTSILRRGTITPFITFSHGFPTLCMTEMSWRGLNFMIGQRGYQPWALMFDRHEVYAAGGGPVWYTRPREYETLAATPELRSWAVRLDPGSDWTEEREWRLPCAPDEEGRVAPIPLTTLGFCGVIVDDPQWSCPVPDPFTDGSRPEHWDDAVRNIPKYWWGGQELEYIGS